MNIEIQYRPAHALACVQLHSGESIRAESGAMVSMSSNVAVTTDGPSAGGRGGLLSGLKRAVLSGESFFTNTFTARGGGGTVELAPKLCGDMVVHEVTPGDDLLIQGSSYVAAPDTVTINTQFQGFKGFFSGESLFFLKATGNGPVILNAFGAIQRVDLDGELIVDTGHLVAFSAGISYEVSKASDGLIASFLSGEGLVLRVRGRGTLYLQTRNPNEYGSSVGGRLPPK
ncbi:TIGR00266 family protein [Myxococcota bacterium]|nr:TIGR00266 family protein [Myxococcota bacterium]MBU1429675.1 TIGR00266 family protein [Myxococcota bacterium]MBU1898136.1 TIGR00266 family protein [Myxococcota bacterium]